ncbi:radical SAM protein [Parabacteroides sp.]
MEKQILIHGYTGAIDIVNKNLADQLMTLQEINQKTFSSELLTFLMKRGYVTDKTEEDEYSYVSRIVRTLHQKELMSYKTFTFVISYNCNFRCPYCFENRNKKDTEFYTTFSREMVDKAYLAIKNIESRKPLRNKIITLYGGEPLLARNKDILTYLILEGHKKGYKFHAISNGYELDHFLELLSSDLIFKVQVTIDGTKDYHNQRRIHYQALDTFDKIISNIELALKQGISITVRVNNDNRNVENFAQLKAYFESIGFYTYPNFKLYSAMLHNNEAITNDEKTALTFSSSRSYISKHKEMGTEKTCKDYGLYQRIYNALKEKKPIPFKGTFCASQSGGYVLDCFGDIYPCWEVVGNKEFCIGNYLEKDINWNDNLVEKWHTYDISMNSFCRKCKYALYCGGGCVAHVMSGKRNHCSYFQNIFDLAVKRALCKALY